MGLTGYAVTLLLVAPFEHAGQDARGAAPADVVRELTAIEEQLASTYKNHDCDGWAALLADEWQVAHITGEVITKQAAVKACRSAPEVSARYEELSVRSYGAMAIVTGINNASVATSPPQTVRLRFTDVFVRRNDRWVVVASHASAFPAK
jgi:hypothetical protein